MIGDPLTLEQLRGMERPTPVWAEIQNKTVEGWDGYWCLCVRGHILTPGLISMYAEKMEGVKFYAYPPIHIDREAWTGCVCNSGKKNCCTCISMECNACIGESKYKQGRYCSSCGRPLNEEAWAELEKRLRG